MEKKNQTTRRSLSNAENYHLWMVSGGLCSFEGCRKRLIASTDGLLTNVGIKAHIIGHAEGSARHQYMEEYGYTQDTLEDVSNLTLMCHYHSKLIDDEHTRDHFPPDKLFKMKEDHEKWVASWSEQNKKKSIALIHKRLGTPLTNIEYDGEAPCILVEAVEDQNQFTDYSAKGWTEGLRNNEKLYERFINKIKEREIDVAEIYPLSPIPLLVHMGFLLTDTLTLSVYQFDREKEVWVTDKPGGNSNEETEIQTEQEIDGQRDLAVLVSISGTVKTQDVKDSIEEPFDFLSITINNPGVKRILYKEDVKLIQSHIKEKVEHLIQQQDYEKIHLFLAVPAGLAIEIGRGINPRMWGEVSIYEFNRGAKPKYQYALSLIQKN